MTKLFIQETGSDYVIALVDELHTTSRFVSALARLEIRSALRRREAAQEISPDTTGRAIDRLEAELLDFTVLDLSAEILNRSRQVIDIYRLRALDAMQLASALSLTATSSAPLITVVAADQALLEAAARAGLGIVNPENEAS